MYTAEPTAGKGI